MEALSRVGKKINCSVGGEDYFAYIPQHLPPKPNVDLEGLYPLLEKATIALGRLDGMSLTLPEPALFLYMYIRKEAVFSSQIEGTQSSLSDLLAYESTITPGVPLDDVTEVSNYVAAMNYGLERLKTFPLSLRLIREIHGILMSSGRGSSKAPGEFRTSQNWIGGSRPGNARFVPPPPEQLMESLGALELFLHDGTVKLPSLIKAALAHVQFETIHPFLDGNGRLGRLLITFILCAEGVIQQPLLYLSLYLKTNRQAYYDHLQSVRDTGDWEAWVQFFLQGIVETANQATETVQLVLKLFDADKAYIQASGKSASAILTVHQYLQHHPVTTTTRIKESCDMSLPTVLRALKTLESLEIVKEITGKERHKVFVYREYLDLLNRGTEPFNS